MDPESQEQLGLMLHGLRTAALGTLRNGAPLVSMVLFVAAPDFQYVFLHTSRLAPHTQDMLQDPRVSLMISEVDSAQDLDPQLLRRIGLQGEVAVVPKDSKQYSEAYHLYMDKYPQVDYTFMLGDFDFYCMMVKRARYVAGFGKAFNLLPADLKRAALG